MLYIENWKAMKEALSSVQGVGVYLFTYERQIQSVEHKEHPGAPCNFTYAQKQPSSTRALFFAFAFWQREGISGVPFITIQHILSVQTLLNNSLRWPGEFFCLSFILMTISRDLKDFLHRCRVNWGEKNAPHQKYVRSGENLNKHWTYFIGLDLHFILSTCTNSNLY